VTLSSEVTALATRLAQEFNSVRTALAGKAALSHTHPPSVGAIGGAGDWDRAVFGDICSTGHRDDATGTQAMSTTIRTHMLLLGRVPAGQAIAGFRMARTVAAVAGVGSAALFSSATLGATSWARYGTAVAPVLTGTGIISTAYAIPAQASDLWWVLQYTLTTAPTTYPTFAGSPALTAAVAALHLVGTQPVAGYSSGATAPGATLNPTSGWTTNTIKPWAALY
jgi:hypothetical protein